MTQLTREPIDPHALTEAVYSRDAGAVVLFLGTVRERTGAEVTLALEYDAYAPMARRQLEAIEAEVRSRWPVAGVAIAHRLGTLGVGEVSVAVAVSSPHRADAFEAARYAIDALKERVPIWKKDHTLTGETAWVHPPAAQPGGAA